jgi:hypothetical protein
MPVEHLVKDCTNETPDPEDSEVKLQHLNEYVYSEQITPKAVHEVINKMEADKAVAEAKSRRVEAKLQLQQQEESVRLNPFLEKAAPILDELRRRIFIGIEDTFKEIHTDTGLECFITGGSWPSKRIADSLCDLCENTTIIPDFEPFHLVSNDIEIYHGPTCEQDAPLQVNLNGITKHKNESVNHELNLVKCDSYTVRLVSLPTMTSTLPLRALRLICLMTPFVYMCLLTFCIQQCSRPNYSSG